MVKLSAAKGPLGTRVAVVDPEHQILGEFLTIEAPGRGSWVCTHLLPILYEIRCGVRSEYVGGGDAHELTVNQSSVRIDTVYRVPKGSYETSFTDFLQTIEYWCQQCTRGRGTQPRAKPNEQE